MILEHLGDLYAAMGLTGKARESYRSSLEFDSKNQTVQDKLNALQEN